jgi:predicted membrane channel-forming protein YqfA (hemolysin III family)
MRQLRPSLSSSSGSATDELVNASTHALGLVVALIGALVMTFGVLRLVMRGWPPVAAAI